MHEKLGNMVVWRRFSGVATFFLHAIDDFLQSNAKVSLKELQLLIQLRSGGGTLRMMDLASRLRITKAGITKMVGRLEQQDLVQRQVSETDRRVKYVTLTDGGLERLAGTAPKMTKWLHAHFLDVFDEAELKMLNTAMLKLIDVNDMADPADRN